MINLITVEDLEALHNRMVTLEAKIVKINEDFGQLLTEIDEKFKATEGKKK